MTNAAYFSNCDDVATIKTMYKTLAMRWHPDRPGGNTVIMQEINAAYKTALSGQHGVESVDENGTAHTYYYKEATEQAVIDKIAEVIASGVLQSTSVELWLIGTWLWVKGDTKPYRKTLGREGLGFQWNQNRACWQWHLPTKYRSNNSPHGFEYLAGKYGAAHIAQPQEAGLSHS
jgi:hypothetical protein